MKESDLYQPARQWLQRQYPEHAVHVEKFDADVIAIKGDHVVVVELKACLTEGLFRQCCTRSAWANEVWVCVGTNPREMRRFQAGGFGVLKFVNGKIRKVRGAKPQPWLWHKMRKHRLKRLTNEAPAMEHEVAGLPACAALREQRLMLPKAKAMFRERQKAQQIQDCEEGIRKMDLSTMPTSRTTGAGDL